MEAQYPGSLSERSPEVHSWEYDKKPQTKKIEEDEKKPRLREKRKTQKGLGGDGH